MKNYILICIIYFSLLSFLSAQESTRFAEAIEKIENRDRELNKSEVHTVFVGSSSFTRWVDFEKDFDTQKIVNNGFGGSRLSDVIYYFDRVIMPYTPLQIIVYEGDNDIASGMTSREYLRDVKAFIRMVEIKLPGTHISFLSPKPSPSRRSLTEEFLKANQGLAMLAAQNPGVDFIDISQVMYGLNGEIKKEIWVSDSLHMNRSGYDLWAPIIKSYIRQ